MKSNETREVVTPTVTVHGLLNIISTSVMAEVLYKLGALVYL